MGDLDTDAKNCIKSVDGSIVNPQSVEN